MAIKAISPKEAREQYDPMKVFPECIIQAINEIITTRVNSLPSNKKSFKLYQKEVFEAIDKAIKDYNDNKSSDKEPLVLMPYYRDIEIPYRQQGWIITVDWPAYNEDYQGNWLFKFPE